MMIYHGDDQIKSRTFWLLAKTDCTKKQLLIVDLDGQNLTLPHLTSFVESSTLFGQTNAVFISNILTRRPSNEKKTITDYLAKHAADQIYIWESKEVTTTLPNQNFSLPKYIFTFLDNLDLNSYHKCLQAMPAEQIFASLVTRLHKNLLATGIPHPKYLDLLKIDFAQKTSSSPFDLSSALELWLLKLK
jgi:hypothetical protein